MKKLSLLFIVLLFASCDNKVIEVQQEAGFDYGRDAKYILGTDDCLLYTSPSPRDGLLSRMPSSA